MNTLCQVLLTEVTFESVHCKGYGIDGNGIELKRYFWTIDFYS